MNHRKPGDHAAGKLDAALGSSKSDSASAGMKLASFHPSSDLDADPQHGGGGGGGGGGGHGGGGGGGTGGGGGGGGGGGKGRIGRRRRDRGHRRCWRKRGAGERRWRGRSSARRDRSALRESEFHAAASHSATVSAIGGHEPAGAYALAAGTGGFPIFNTNDLLNGLQKIAAEQNEYYLLGFAPSDSAEGSCHTLKVKVERSGTNACAQRILQRETDRFSGRKTDREGARSARPRRGHESGSGSLSRRLFLHCFQRSAGQLGDGNSAIFGGIQ
jgi:hypothetical protein